MKLLVACKYRVYSTVKPETAKIKLNMSTADLYSIQLIKNDSK